MIAVVIVVVVAAVVVILRVGGHTTLVPNFSSQPEGDRARKKMEPISAIPKARTSATSDTSSAVRRCKTWERLTRLTLFE